MRHIPSTAEIVAFKMLGRSIDKTWVDWAYDMLIAGFETEELVNLAGEIAPYNQFELQPLTDKIFNELGLTYDVTEQVYKNYVCYLATEALASNRTFEEVLRLIKNIYLELDQEEFFQEFALLHWALDDLSYSHTQHYWEGATRENIHEVIREYFVKWVKGNCVVG